ncbi:aspartyl/asparaginyl beta-hydroxylase (cupin superfamily) [Bradyrhizobium sp. USDA 4449]
MVSTVGPVIPVEQFPELKPLSQNWETIRDEAVGLFDGGFIGGRQEQRLGPLLVLQKWPEGPDKPRHDIRDIRVVF